MTSHHYDKIEVKPRWRRDQRGTECDVVGCNGGLRRQLETGHNLSVCYVNGVQNRNQPAMCPRSTRCITPSPWCYSALL